MNTILVPTDFSAPAKKAFLFALELALKTNARILVCHVFQRLSPFIADTSAGREEPRQLASKQMEVFLQAASSSNYAAVPLDVSLQEGNTLTSLCQTITQTKAELVVMGTKGAHHRLGRFFGTLTETLAKKGPCPVLAIPEKASLQSIEQMVYTSTLEHSEVPALYQLLQIKNTFQAQLTILHIKSEEQVDLVEDEEVKAQLREEFPEEQFRFETVVQENVAEGIIDYIENNATDLLAFTVLEPDFWQILFHDSVTAHLLHSLHIPMLALPFQSPSQARLQDQAHEQLDLENSMQ